jgi:hypothetical protein
MGSNPRSSPPPSLKKLSPHDAKQALMGMVSVASRPLLIGVAAVRLGALWSLEETENLFHDLVDEGRIRLISKAEQDEHGLHEGYVLVGVDPRK